SGDAAPAGAQAEPVNVLARRFLSDLTAAQAAAECGLETRHFQERLPRSPRLISLGMGQLAVANGGIKRDTWEKNFGEVASELQLGAYITARARRGILAPGLNRLRTGAPAARAPILSTDTNEILRSARTIFVMSRTMYLKPDQ